MTHEEPEEYLDDLYPEEREESIRAYGDSLHDWI
jgi:hypothetical protein